MCIHIYTQLAPIGVREVKSAARTVELLELLVAGTTYLDIDPLLRMI